MEKHKTYFSRACRYQSEIGRLSLLAAVCKRYVPKSKEKTFNTAVYVRRAGDHREEMQFSAYYS